MATAPLQHLLQQRRIWQGATFTAGHDMVNCQANIWASRCWCTIPIVTHIPTDRCCALRMTKQCTPLQRPIHGHPGTYSGQHTPSRTQQNSAGASALGLFTNRTCPAAAAVLATCWWNQLWVDQTPHEQNCCGTTAPRASTGLCTTSASTTPTAVHVYCCTHCCCTHCCWVRLPRCGADVSLPSIQPLYTCTRPHKGWCLFF
jgi:hypothetical protein